MWPPQPKYPQKDPLPIIKDPSQLPSNAAILTSITDTLNRSEEFYIVQQGSQHISILRTGFFDLDTGPRPYCFQNDFPIEFMTWFPKALEDFQKPASQGGLHAGAISSADQDVAGEMLCIQRGGGSGKGQPSYFIVNRSRTKEKTHPDDLYSPQQISLHDNLLFEGGLMDLFEALAKKI